MDEIQTVGPSTGRVLRGLIATVFVLLVGVGVFQVLSKARRGPGKKDAVQGISLKVSAQTVTYEPKLLSLQGFGTVEPYRQVEIVPEVSGKVVFTLRPAFKVGTYVRKGQTLLSIDRSDYALEHSRLKATIDSTLKQIKIAERAYQVSQNNLGRSRRLVRRSALDPGTYEMAEQQVLDRGQRLESLRQSLDVNQILLRRAALNLSRTVLVAPFDARISQGNISVGTFVSAGRPVGAIESVDTVEIPVAFGLEALRNMLDTSGKQMLLTDLPRYLQDLPTVTLQAGKERWEGRVMRVAPGLDRSTRTLTLFVHVDLKKQNQMGNLLPGTFCHAAIPIRRIARAIQLPRQSLYQGNRVYVAEQGKIAVRVVKLAYLDNDSVIVQSGLREGDKVILTPLSDPVVGTPVFLGSQGGKS